MAGAHTVHFPVIEILPADNKAELLRLAQSLDSYDSAIFISRNAVDHGVQLVYQARGTGNWPSTTKIAAIGKGTRSVLDQYGLATAITPAGIPNSENLLADPGMKQVKGKKILIFRGNGGREQLADSLRQRGAVVDYFECYQRRIPNISADILGQIWNDGNRHGIIVTSREGLKNLYQMITQADRENVNKTPLFVVSPAMVELATELGYKQTPVLMPSVANDDVLESVIAYFSKKSV
jgi:uroporphyrinogen-III synthase